MKFDAKAEQTAAFIKSTAVNMSGTALELAVSAFIKAKFLVTGPVVLGHQGNCHSNIRRAGVSVCLGSQC